ncbi:MAG: transglycosylase SLT domain-containing protein [Muribaculaceae bacterium]|nr:transglycosylase SLT domain-containing protein [Muribaculaceae bacterium]
MNIRYYSLIAATIAALTFSQQASAAPSILDIKHSISDDNIVPPESFETKVRDLQENFFVQNFVAPSGNTKQVTTGSARDYEKRLASLPTVIEMPYNSIVGKYIDMYLTKRSSLVENMLALHSFYGNIFLEELLKEGVPTELQYLPVIESAINPNAVSRAGAAGLWQFMPGTGKGMGMEINSLVDERRDPRVSSRCAAKYLHQLYDIYEDWSLAIAAYNCGPGNVNKAMRRAGGGKKDFWEIYNYLPAETRGYLPAFIAANYVMNFYRKHGISPTVVKRHLIIDTLKVSKRVHFNQIAEVLNIPIEEIRMLNPQFRQDIIPGNFHPYTLTLPKQQALSYIISEDAILAHDTDLYAQRTYVEPGETDEAPILDEDGSRNLSAATRQSRNADSNVEVGMVPAEEVVQVSHTVRRGENIKDIAKQYGVSATDIKRWNKLRRGKVKEGDVLNIETRRRIDLENVTAQVSTAPQPAVSSDVPAPTARTPKAEPAAVPEPVKPAKKQEVAAVPEPAATKKAPKQQKTDPAEPKATKNSSKKSKSEAKAQTSNYTVKKGDTLEKIAKKNGVTVDELRKANGMTAKDSKINIDESIKIPSKASAKSSGKKSDSKSSAKKPRKRRSKR